MTDQGETPEATATALPVGVRLRASREKLGLSVADVAARTRISSRHIEDLEAGNFAAFASRTYAIGFARTFAKAVGLDGEAVAGEVRADLKTLQPAERMADGYETSDPARVPSRPLVWLSLVAVGLLLAGLWVAYRTLFSPAAELPSLVQEAPAPVAAASAAPAVAPSAAPATGGAVVFTAMDDAIWVRFYDASGSRLLEKEMRRGESFTVPATANGPMVRTARPEALAITVGGRPVPPLAPEMITVRDVKVDAVSLLARPAPAAMPSASPSVAASPATRDVVAPLRRVPLSVTQRPAAAPRIAATVRQPRPAVSAAPGSQDVAAANAASAAAVAEPDAAPEPAAAEPAAATPAE